MELGFKVLQLLAVAVASVVSCRGSDSSVGGGAGDDGLAGGLGELVLDISAGDLGDGVAVLDLDGDLDDLGVVNAVLGGDLTAGVLHGLGDGVGDSVGNRQRGGDGGDRGSSIGGRVSVGEVLSISVSVSIGLSLPLAVVSNSVGNGSVTQGVDDLSALLLVLDLLGGDGLGGADLLGSRGADLGDQDHVLGDAVWSRGSDGNGGNGVSQRGSDGVAGVAKELSVSLGIGVSSRGGASEGSHAGKGENLGFFMSAVSVRCC